MEKVTIVVYPTRIANAVSYLTHGKTINPILVNPEELDRLQQWVKQSVVKKQQSKWVKHNVHTR